MSVKVQDQEDIAIFWDYESTKSSILRADISTSEIIQNIRSIVFPFGTIKSFRAYRNLNGHVVAKLGNVQSDLFASGVTLMDCPGDGRKELAVKIMLVDMIAHAWSHPSPHTFVIITGDRDVSYGISTLCMRKYRVVVMSPAGTHSDLKAQATTHIDWNEEVLGIHGDVSFPQDLFADMAPPPGPDPPSSSYHQQSQPPTSTNASFTQIGRQSLNGFAKKTIDSQRVSELESFELHDLPARGRRNSVFSTFDPRKFDGFGDLGDNFMTPNSHRGSFGLGDGPLFPRPQSRGEDQARADSAPPGIVYSSMKPAYQGRTVEKGNLGGLVTAPPWKGKARDFPILEPEYIAPQAPVESTHDVSYSRSLFESFGDIKPSFGPTSTVLPSSNTGQPSPKSSTPTNTSRSSPSSAVQHLVASTAPTSAETAADNDDKMESSRRATVEDVSSSTDSSPHVSVAPLPAQKESINDLVMKVATSVVRETQEKSVQSVIPPVVQPVVSSSMNKPPSITPPKAVAPATQKPASSSAKPQATQPTVTIGPQPMRLTGPAVRFQTLVEVLRKEQKKSPSGISKTSLGSHLLKQSPQIYKISGLKKFSLYITAAIDAGIVKETQGGDNVVLLPRYAGP